MVIHCFSCIAALTAIIIRGFGKRKYDKECYIVIVIIHNLSSTLGLNGNEAHCCRVLMGVKPAASDRSTTR